MSIPTILDGNRHIIDPKDKADLFNDNFCNESRLLHTDSFSKLPDLIFQRPVDLMVLEILC